MKGEKIFDQQSKITQIVCMMLLFFLSDLYATLMSPSKKITLSHQDIQCIGKKIWHNECGGSIEKLTWWNKCEPFASLGIGHFIWFPIGLDVPFTQTFPKLMAYLTDHGIVLPPWLADKKTQAYCPWRTREDFLRDSAGANMQELRNLLAATIDLQTEFIIHQACAALPRILSSVGHAQKKHIKKRFYQLAHSQQGMYALIDYLNFKGDGTSVTERYNGQGWGLLQILERMTDNQSDEQSMREFATIAQELLTMRVKNAPQKNNEQKFLAGWKNRIGTYTKSL